MASVLDFPNIVAEGYIKTSEPCWAYNCIAWAFNDKTRWWWPFYDLNGNEGYWPSSANRDLKLATITKIFKSSGYKTCRDGCLEAGVQKIAIYTLKNQLTHAARQLPDGTWTHKLGIDKDVASSLKAFEGPLYGTVTRYMAKPITQ